MTMRQRPIHDGTLQVTGAGNLTIAPSFPFLGVLARTTGSRRISADPSVCD